MIKLTDLQKDVNEYYGKTLGCTADIKTNVCGLGDRGLCSKEAEILT
jgi:hypothetical protein